LIATNPRHPEWGRVIIDREGLLHWHSWGHIADDPGAASTAAVIIAIMARPDDGESSRQPACLTAPAERDRPHP
jgi:hypothetical protein